MTTKVEKNYAGVSVVTCPQCGTIAASATRPNTMSMPARASGGSTIQRPAHENARNRPSAVAKLATKGHSRSQKMLLRARWSARSSDTRAGAAWVSGC